MLAISCPSDLASRHPLAAFFSTLAALPPRHPRRIGLLLLQLGMGLALPALCLGMAVMHLCCALAAVGGLLARPPLHRLPGFWWAAGFAAWQVISVLGVLALHRHPHPLSAIGMMYTWFALYLALVAFADERVRRWACRGLLATVAASAVVALLQFTIGLGGRPPLHIAAPPLGERLHHSTGFAPIHLTQAFTMAMVALVFARLPVVDAQAGKMMRLCGIALAGGALVIANARQAFLAFSTGLGMGIAARGGRRIAFGLGASLACVGLFAAGLQLLTPAYLAEVVEGRDGRFAIWRTSCQLVADSPLIGTGGAEAFKDAYSARYTPQPGDVKFDVVAHAPHAHNSELAIAAEHGLPAALLHLAWLAALAGWAFRARHLHAGAWSLACSLLGTFLMAGMFENLAGHSAPSYVFGITLGLCLATVTGVPERQAQARPA